MIFATISVIALIGVVAAKFLTAASIQNLRKRAAEADTDMRKVRGSAKAAQQANGVAGRGINTKARKKKSLEKQIEENLTAFEKEIDQRPEVVECYLMTGEADYLLRVVVTDLQAYEHFLKDHLTRFPGVLNIRSSFALNQVKYSTALPLNHLSSA